MRNLRTRAIIASEEPEVRRLLTGVVQKDMGGVVAAQAENGIKAVSLARSLRPDLVLVDYRLPHVAGSDDVRLSRIGGLDTAMRVSQELPNARVLVVGDSGGVLATDAGQTHAAELTLYRAAIPAQLAFAGLRAKAASSRRARVDEACEKAMLVGGLSVLAGLGLMLSFIFAGPGVVLALAGAAMFVVGLAVRAGAAQFVKQVHSDLDIAETEAGNAGTAAAHR